MHNRQRFSSSVGRIIILAPGSGGTSLANDLAGDFDSTVVGSCRQVVVGQRRRR